MTLDLLVDDQIAHVADSQAQTLVAQSDAQTVTTRKGCVDLDLDFGFGFGPETHCVDNDVVVDIVVDRCDFETVICRQKTVLDFVAGCEMNLHREVSCVDCRLDAEICPSQTWKFSALTAVCLAFDGKRNEEVLLLKHRSVKKQTVRDQKPVREIVASTEIVEPVVVLVDESAPVAIVAWLCLLLKQLAASVLNIWNLVFASNDVPFG